MTAPFYPKASPLLSSISSSDTSPTMTVHSLLKDASAAASTEKPKKARCEHSGCKAKLGLLGFDCKCGAKYCGTHRYPEAHDCGYNYRAAGEAQLAKQLLPCVGDKLSGGRI
jgi:hypothetical protein